MLVLCNAIEKAFIRLGKTCTVEKTWRKLSVNVNEEIHEQLKEPLALGMFQIKIEVFL